MLLKTLKQLYYWAKSTEDIGYSRAMSELQKYGYYVTDSGLLRRDHN